MFRASLFVGFTNIVGNYKLNKIINFVSMEGGNPY
nr:MAG TPA: hypothetical protein [Caudoviricetes sp.]DAV28903.1 MAG TPA: hypothetical protein [Caudoviricetes sp.]